MTHTLSHTFILLLIGIVLLHKYIPTGTKSILFGVHCFFIHPFYVAWAWTKLYGFPYDFRLWFAFFVHDLGYWGCNKMDDEKGEMHPYFGARVMHKMFDRNYKLCYIEHCKCEACESWRKLEMKWYNFTLYHSRFLAKRNDEQYSKLCVADKLAITLTPKWLYIPCANLSGEIKEYMKDAAKNSNGTITPQTQYKLSNQIKWKNSVDDYVRNWVEEHKDMKVDNWTTANRQVGENGTWK